MTHIALQTPGGFWIPDSVIYGIALVNLLYLSVRGLLPFAESFVFCILLFNLDYIRVFLVSVLEVTRTSRGVQHKLIFLLNAPFRKLPSRNQLENALKLIL